jgi:xylose isomerase
MMPTFIMMSAITALYVPKPVSPAVQQILKQGLTKGHFVSLPDKIPFEGPTSRNPLAFKFYEADRVVAGKPMKEWLRFAVCYWHTWRGNGADIFGLDGSYGDNRPWDMSNTLEAALARVDVHFEFCQKLGAPFYCFHDRDVSPEGATVAETDEWMDRVADRLEAGQQATGVQLLWGTCNLFSHRRYMHGGPTNPDPAVVAMAAAQVKKCLEVTHRLGGENFVLWGGRDGYQSLLNTDMEAEAKNYAFFLRMTRDYARSIGFEGQLLLEPKPREPSAHQYNFDAETTLGFLDRFDLLDDFALNLEANHGTLAGHSGEHEVEVAFSRNKLGSIDTNRNEMLLGWDTDMFPTDPALATYTMVRILQQGGLQPGGLNFDAKVRRESTDLEDLFVGHINGMDNYARGLLSAAKLLEGGELEAMRIERYQSFQTTDLGQQIVAGTTSLEDLAAYAATHPEPELRSGKQEAFESVFNSYAYE